LGNPGEYEKVHIKIKSGDKITRADMIRKLVNVYFERTNADLRPGVFRALGNAIDRYFVLHFWLTARLHDAARLAVGVRVSRVIWKYY
jgi:excinuclease UvrABC helicase subunit UvrB